MYRIIRSRQDIAPVMKQKVSKIKDEWSSAEIEYLTFPSLERTGIVEHLFTTRMGGVSQGFFSTMNLSFTRGDDTSAVLRNYERVGKVLGCEVTNMVASHQTHTTNIRRVTAADRGKGIVFPRDYDDMDGLITDEKNIALVTYFADCVPIYLVDPVQGAIGLAHSGWRGTVGKMGSCMVKAMQEAFGSNPRDMIAAIGPSICQECYEVSAEVALEFEKLLQEIDGERYLSEITYCSDAAVIKPGKQEGKYQLDLWLANWLILRYAGIPLEQIEMTDVCTCHNPDYLFSHRASEGKRGNLAAFLMLK